MQDLLDAFYAKGGKVSKVETGKTTYGMTNAEWRRQTQKTKAERLAEIEEDILRREQEAEQRHERVTQARIAGGYAAAIDALDG